MSSNPPYPEDTVNWLERYPGRCYFWPARDCPGCAVDCARFWRALPVLEVVMRDD